MPPRLSDADAAFLRPARIGVLISLTAEGRPLGVPVWFEWTGTEVLMFSAADAPKTTRLRRRPEASLLVAAGVGEPERWIAFDGPVEIDEREGFALAERLAERYWDLNDPAKQRTLATWRAHPDAFCRLVLRPQRIRTGG